jgi:hypothetical protein
MSASFGHSFTVYGFARDIPEWMDIRRQTDDFRRETGSTHVPFLKIIGDADLYCFGNDGRITRWDHETEEFRFVQRGSAELLDHELAELKARKKRKKADCAANDLS